MTPTIAVVDYGAGNLRSIRRALEAAGARVVVTSDPTAVAAADAVVLPGVGAAGAAMERLRDLGLVPAIEAVVADGRPFFGICLGMQLLFRHQDEGNVEGLGLLAGSVRALDGAVKVPQIGWNRVRLTRSGPFGEAGDERYFYFVHSYVVAPDDPADVVAETRYGDRFPSLVLHDNVWGAQFHPEKSGDDGLALVQRFVDHVRQRAEMLALAGSA
ncbi:MAG TPA: imidazole glycerol phosphate synthase subunit HisH [Thermomicrobiales bacterium]|nr:imidazole glycerol phosphate synthase subunit HisH [Thermomicrobiales bacterium]